MEYTRKYTSLDYVDDLRAEARAREWCELHDTVQELKRTKDLAPELIITLKVYQQEMDIRKLLVKTEFLSLTDLM